MVAELLVICYMYFTSISSCNYFAKAHLMSGVFGMWSL